LEPAVRLADHSLVPIDVPIAGHRWMLVADEHVQPLDPTLSPELAAALWMVNITDEPVGTGQLFPAAGIGRIETPLMTACHQARRNHHRQRGSRRWFANGSGDRYRQSPVDEAGRLVDADVPAGNQRVCSNDVYVDHRGLIYLIDRNRGLSILERV